MEARVVARPGAISQGEGGLTYSLRWSWAGVLGDGGFGVVVVGGGGGSGGGEAEVIQGDFKITFSFREVGMRTRTGQRGPAKR